MQKVDTIIDKLGLVEDNSAQRKERVQHALEEVVLLLLSPLRLVLALRGVMRVRVRLRVVLRVVVVRVVALELRADRRDAQEGGEEGSHRHQDVALRGVGGVGVFERANSVDLLRNETANVWQETL